MNEIRKHLFLTGPKQVGKSTLLRRLIESKALDCAGFETRAFFINDERRGFTLHGRVNMPPFENDCICCVRVQQQKSVAINEVFDHNGVQILTNSLASSAPYLLMDELGKLEAGAEVFCAQVLKTLDGEKRILGVLQQCDSMPVKAIASRKDVTVLTVTPENREELYRLLEKSY